MWLGIFSSSHFYSRLFMHGHVMAHLKYLKVFVALLLFALHLDIVAGSSYFFFYITNASFRISRQRRQGWCKRTILCLYLLIEVGKKYSGEQSNNKRLKLRMQMYRLVGTEEKHHRIYAHCCCYCFRCHRQEQWTANNLSIQQ